MKSVETIDVRVPVEQRLAQRQAALQPGHGGGEDQLGVDAELAAQLAPATARRGRASRARRAAALALGEQLGGDQAGLDGLADADVVGDQQPDGVLPQRHQQRHELVGAGLDGDAGEGPERAGAGAEPEPQRGAQQAGGVRCRRGRRASGGRRCAG